jgi:hypothetical protein
MLPIVIGLFVVLLAGLTIARAVDVPSPARTVTAAASVVWPVVWFSVVGFDKAQRAPFASIGLLWPSILLAWEAYNDGVTTAPGADAGTTFSSLAFALGALFASSIGKEFARTNVVILSTCVLLVLLYVSPSRETPYTNAAKHAILTYAAGLLLSAVGRHIHAAA